MVVPDMTEPDCDDFAHEHLSSEINTVKQCAQCGQWNMLIRDPRNLDNESVFAYDPMCGLTYFVRLI